MKSLDEQIRAIVRDELRRLRVLDDGQTFSSDAPPPGVSRRAFRMRCSSGVVADARKVGKVWTCSRAAWFAKSVKPVAKVAAVNDDDALADQFLNAAGLRATRGASR